MSGNTNDYYHSGNGQSYKDWYDSRTPTPPVDTSAVKPSSMPATEGAVSKITELDRVVVTASMADLGRDDVDQFTYHLKLYLTKQFDRSPTATKYVLAESGSTDIHMQDLELKSVISYNTNTYTTSMLDMTFKLVEPGGCSLLDRIASVADEIGIDNFVKCTYFLEVSFRGRDIVSGQPLTSVDVKRVIPILILKNEIDISSTGTTYTIKAVYYHDSGTSDQLGVIQNPVTIDKENKVSEVLNRLAEILNTRKEDENTGSGATNDKVSNIYEFQVDPRITENNGDLIVRQAVDEQAHKNIPMEFVDFSSTTITLSDNTSINRCIDQLMSVSSYMTREVQNKDSKADRSVAADVNFYKVEVEVQQIGFNKTLNDYTKKIIYRVVAVRYSEPETSSIDDIEIFKKYDYIFTGNNTEVLNFECKLNNAWYIPLPRLATAANVSSSQLGVLSSKSSPDNVNAENAQSNQNDMAPSKSLTDFNASGAIPRSKWTPEQEAALSADPRVREAGAQVAANKAYREKQLDEMWVSMGSIGPSPSSRRAGASRSALTQSDDEDSAGADVYVKAPTSAPKSEIRQSYTHDQGESNTQGAVESARDNSRSYVATMLDRKITDGNSADLLQARISVRGDPKWLTISGTDPIFIEFNMGVPFRSSSDSLPETSQSYKNRIISGVYRVLEVTNNFEGGKYTQELNCIKIFREDDSENDAANEDSNQAAAESGTAVSKGESGSRQSSEAPPRTAAQVADDATNRAASRMANEPTTTAELIKRKKADTTTQTVVPVIGTKPVEQAKD